MITRRKIIQFFVVLGLFFNVAYIMYLYFIFLIAYFSPEKRITIYINLLGEADFEIGLITFATTLGISATTYVLIEMRKRRENRLTWERSKTNIRRYINKLRGIPND